MFCRLFRENSGHLSFHEFGILAGHQAMAVLNYALAYLNYAFFILNLGVLRLNFATIQGNSLSGEGPEPVHEVLAARENSAVRDRELRRSIASPVRESPWQLRQAFTFG
jgi:hypothetical protein